MLNTWWKPTAREKLNHHHIIALLKVTQWLLLLVENLGCLTPWLMRLHVLKMSYPISCHSPFWLHSAKLVFLLPQTCQAYSHPWAFAHALSAARNIPACMLILSKPSPWWDRNSKVSPTTFWPEVCFYHNMYQLLSLSGLCMDLLIIWNPHCTLSCNMYTTYKLNILTHCYLPKYGDEEDA